MDSKRVGQRIKQRREKLNLDQLDIFLSTGIKQEKVSLIESGKRKIQFDEIKPLAEALLVPVRWFFYEDEFLMSPNQYISNKTSQALASKAHDAWLDAVAHIYLDGYEMGQLGKVLEQ